MLGIYEASVKKISFETGIRKDDVIKALKGFETLGKVKYIKNYIILCNFLKHQNFNTNMKKSAIDVYNGLPKELKNNNVEVCKSNPLKGFETLLNHYGMVSKIEVEDEVEIEDESKEKGKKDSPPSFDEFLDYAKEKSFEQDLDIDETKVNLKYQSWIENNWRTGKNKKIVNWKSTLLNTLVYLKKEKDSGQKEKRTASTAWREFVSK